MGRKFELVSKYIGTDIEKTAIMPRRGTKFSACYDIFNNTGKDIVLQPGEISSAITTHIKVQMEPDEVCKFFPRSGHGFKFGIRLISTVGIIDADYYGNINNEGECFVKFQNHGTKEFILKACEAMAQAMFQKYLITDDDADTVGGDRVGGFGSTSK